jgi:hypothetical protein
MTTDHKTKINEYLLFRVEIFPKFEDEESSVKFFGRNGVL